MIRTTRSISVLAIALVAAGLAATGTPAAAKRMPTPPIAYDITAVRAFLYFHDSGTVGDKDITDGKVALWNTMIGEGDAGAPSSATMIQVELAGPSFSNVSGSLEVVVTAGKKKLLKQKLDVGTYFNEHGQKLVFPFFVYNTACDALKVTATFTTPEKKKIKKSAEIPFGCGE